MTESLKNQHMKARSLEWTLHNAALWLPAVSYKYAMFEQVLTELNAMGWEVKNWDAPDDRKVQAYSVTMRKGKLHMLLTARTEWPSARGAAIEGVFVDKVQLEGYPKLTGIVVVPVRDTTDTTVTRDDPVTTAVALSLYSYAELVDTFSPEARAQRAAQALKDSAGDVLRDMLD